MRPIKEILREEYWNIAYRFSWDDEKNFDSEGAFDVLPESKRYWYADPFVFEHDSDTYLFFEMFDNVTEKGLIGVSVLEGNTFSAPKVVLEESFHLSYPNVFLENGSIYMMPETMGDKCVCLYRATDFPYKWERVSTLVKDGTLVDTVICDDWLLASKVTDPYKKETQLQLYKKSTGEEHPMNNSFEKNQVSRGAGRIFEHGGRRIRPAQNCSGGIYGAGLVFYSVDEISDTDYKETEVFRVEPSQIKLSGGSSAEGVHTYARCGKVEIVDVKKYRFNLKRVCWILSKYLGR